jgi:hypothetical protein
VTRTAEEAPGLIVFLVLITPHPEQTTQDRQFERGHPLRAGGHTLQVRTSPKQEKRELQDSGDLVVAKVAESVRVCCGRPTFLQGRGRSRNSQGVKDGGYVSSNKSCQAFSKTLWHVEDGLVSHGIRCEIWRKTGRMIGPSIAPKAWTCPAED